MAELVDAADSKSAVRKDVQVRFLFWAQSLVSSGLQGFFILYTFMLSFLQLTYKIITEYLPQKKI